MGCEAWFGSVIASMTPRSDPGTGSMRVQSCSLPTADLCEIHSHPSLGALRLAFAQVLKPLVMSIQYMVPSYPERARPGKSLESSLPLRMPLSYGRPVSRTRDSHSMSGSTLLALRDRKYLRSMGQAPVPRLSSEPL